MEQLREAAAVSWRWHPGDEPDATRTQEAAAARKRGALGGLLGLLLAGAALLFHRPATAAVVASLALLTTLLAMASPLFLYRGLTAGLNAFAHGVGTAMTWVLMTLLFYLLFLPVGLLMRATGKLDMRRFADPRVPTYWTPTAGRERGADPYRKQF